MDNPKHPDPAQELPPPPEEKLLPAHAQAAPEGKHSKAKMLTMGIILVIILEAVSIYFLKTENDVKFLQSLFGVSPTSAPTATPTPTPQPSPTNIPTPTYSVPSASTESGAICPADVMECPDGSSVGRIGPMCEFVCPKG